MISLVIASVLAMAQPIQANKVQVDQVDTIRVLPVSRTPESNTVVLAIALPKNGDMRSGNRVWVQFRLDGYSLGTGSQFDRASEVGVSKMGQTIHVVVDNHPYFAVNEPSIDPFNEDGFYYDTSYKFEIPYTLSPGMHTIRMFPARSFGESLKGENVFQTAYFYVGNTSGGAPGELNQPYITYNEPSDQIPLKASQPVLLDFYVKNCELSADGYKVLLTVDHNMKRTLTSWQPYYIYGLQKGKHTIRLELVDYKGKVVPGPFNDVQRTIQIN